MTGGWTKCPNRILELMATSPGSTSKVLAVIVRKNYGWSNPNETFSVRYLAAKTGLSKSTCHRIVAKLVADGTLKIIGAGAKGARKIVFASHDDGTQLQKGHAPKTERPIKLDAPSPTHGTSKRNQQNKPVRTAEPEIKPQAASVQSFTTPARAAIEMREARGGGVCSLSKNTEGLRMLMEGLNKVLSSASG